MTTKRIVREFLKEYPDLMDKERLIDVHYGTREGVSHYLYVGKRKFERRYTPGYRNHWFVEA